MKELMWRNGQLQSQLQSTSNANTSTFLPFSTEKSFLQLLPHDMSAAWALGFWALLHRSNCGVFMSLSKEQIKKMMNWALCLFNTISNIQLHIINKPQLKTKLPPPPAVFYGLTAALCKRTELPSSFETPVTVSQPQLANDTASSQRSLWSQWI